MVSNHPRTAIVAISSTMSYISVCDATLSGVAARTLTAGFVDDSVKSRPRPPASSRGAGRWDDRGGDRLCATARRVGDMVVGRSVLRRLRGDERRTHGSGDGQVARALRAVRVFRRPDGRLLQGLAERARGHW